MTFQQRLENFAQNVMAGGVSASIAKTINSPLEVAKLIRQTQPERYGGLIELMTKLPKEEGIKAFWAGNFTNVMRYFPTQALNFAFKDTYKDLLTPKGVKFNAWEGLARNLLSGGLAGASSLVFCLSFGFG